MSEHAALSIGTVAAQEAWRVEKKFSRYRNDSVTAWIHENRGTTIEVDAETASLMDFASQCFELSEGLFDITSGVLRRAWTFDGSDRIPDAAVIEQLLPLVGFEKLQWRSPRLVLPAGMELDFGGIGKEYAVDRAYEFARRARLDPISRQFRRRLARQSSSLARTVAGRHRAAGYRAGSDHAAGSGAWRARHERRLAPLFAKGRNSVWPHFESPHGLADARIAALHHRCGQQLHGSRIAIDGGHVAWRRRTSVLGRTRRTVLDPGVTAGLARLDPTIPA